MAAANLNHPPSPDQRHSQELSLFGDPAPGPAAAGGQKARRGRVQLKRIEDDSSRQVTFSKRRNGLMKKARELAVLCDVDIALIIFSSRGRLYEFSGKDNIRNITERYVARMEEEKAVRRSVHEAQPNQREKTSGSSDGSNLLQIIQRQTEEGNLDRLSVADLSQLELRIDSLLRSTRSRKTEIMLEAMSSFSEQEKKLRTENEVMQMEISASLSDEYLEGHRDPSRGSEPQFSAEADPRNNYENYASSPQQPMLAFL